jgi:predicted amidohydrolase
MKEGDAFPTFQLDFARVGIMTCYDGYFPECASSLSLGGAEFICWINGRAGPVEPWIVQTDMFRNYCAMVTTNLAPSSGTMIGTWTATLLAHITESGVHYISADINLKILREYRANSRTFHQRKPEIYRAIVESHKPWKAYEPYGHVEPAVPPVPIEDATE